MQNMLLTDNSSRLVLVVEHYPDKSKERIESFDLLWRTSRSWHSKWLRLLLRRFRNWGYGCFTVRTDLL